MFGVGRELCLLPFERVDALQNHRLLCFSQLQGEKRQLMLIFTLPDEYTTIATYQQLKNA